MHTACILCLSCREIISEILTQNYVQAGEAGKLAPSPLEALNVTVTCDPPLCTHCPIILQNG